MFNKYKSSIVIKSFCASNDDDIDELNAIRSISVLMSGWKRK